MKLNRVRKALVAAGAAAAGAFGAWRVPNRLSYAELRRQLDEAARDGR